jgi:hypothetical protein
MSSVLLSAITIKQGLPAEETQELAASPSQRTTGLSVSYCSRIMTTIKSRLRVLTLRSKGSSGATRSKTGSKGEYTVQIV